MAQDTTQSTSLSALSTGMADAVEHVAPALVMVDARRRLPASGVVFAENLVLTADHVVEREEDITVTTHDGRTLPATFVGRDTSSDLAVLQVESLNLAPATQAESARVGQFLLAVGRPSQEGPTASFGIVSTAGGSLRTRRGGMLKQHIRTDAVPYPGFSGGPLVNTEGQVLAIMTTGLARGVAIGIPAHLAWEIGDTLAQDGQMKRGYLGITSQPVNLPDTQRAGRTQRSGLLIMHIEPDSPAANGGLLLGDILVSLDGEAINDTGELQALLVGSRVGRDVPVEVIRGRALQILQIVIGEKQVNEQESMESNEEHRHGRRHGHWGGFWRKHKGRHGKGHGRGHGKGRGRGRGRGHGRGQSEE